MLQGLFNVVEICFYHKLQNGFQIFFNMRPDLLTLCPMEVLTYSHLLVILQDWLSVSLHQSKESIICVNLSDVSIYLEHLQSVPY